MFAQELTPFTINSIYDVAVKVFLQNAPGEDLSHLDWLVLITAEQRWKKLILVKVVDSLDVCEDVKLLTAKGFRQVIAIEHVHVVFNATFQWIHIVFLVLEQFSEYVKQLGVWETEKK